MDAGRPGGYHSVANAIGGGREVRVCDCSAEQSYFRRSGVAYGDPRLLARVFDNVLANAVSYNRDGGRIEISGTISDGAPAGRVDMVIITVRDTGSGIPPGEFERVFERFYRIEHSRARGTGGSGLGLAICREVLAALRGSIRIAASSSEGTTFEISLPGRLASSDLISAPLVQQTTVSCTSGAAALDD